MTASPNTSRVINSRRATIIPDNIGQGPAREDTTYDTEIDLMNPYITCYMWKRTA